VSGAYAPGKTPAVRDTRREDRRTRRWIAAAALAGIAIRLAFAFGYWVNQPLTRDEREYLSLARSLTAGRGYVYDEATLGGNTQPFGRAPGYPVFLALVGAGGHSVEAVPAAAKIAQALVAAAGIALVGALAWRLAGPRAARAASALAAVYPPLVWLSAYAFCEALFWPIGLFSAWLVGRAGANRRGPVAIAAGVATAAALLTRPMMLFFVPLAAVWLGWRRSWRLAGLFVAAVLLTLAPWSIRTSIAHGRFVLVASEGGVTFWTGNHPLASGEGDMAANPTLKQANRALRAAHPALTEEQMEPIYYREAFAWIARHPVQWLGLELRKLFYTFVPAGPSYTLHSARYVSWSIASYGVVFVLAIAGLLRSRPDLARTPGLWLLAAASLITCLAFFPQERFRLPVLDPVLVIAAGALWANRVELARA
jgi:4-amino-4-deoxy-L-arabinose transferase-like glycosyltransferase